MDDLDRCKNLLKDLVAFPTLSGQSTRAIADYVSDYLSQFGVTSQYFTDDSGEMINLFATIGPEIDGGVILSGHFDVVPADPRGWESDPFALTERNGRLYGRGSVDMKGFLAMVLASVPQMVKDAGKLQRPFHIAFTYDEETCSYGVRELVKSFPALGFKPGAAIVGEPTGMTPIVGHKGGCELETVFRGKAGHASRPAEGVNTIQYAARLITHLYELSADLASHPQPGSPFDPPYSTINVGRIEGGEARNIIAGECRLSWEIRPIPEDDSSQILDGIKAFINDELVPDMQAVDPAAGVHFSEEAYFPALPAEHGPALKLVQDAWQTSAPQVVSFGTDGGCFSAVGISTVVCGPGDLDRAHKPNEYIEIAELAEGLEFLSRLGQCLQVAK